MKQAIAFDKNKEGVFDISYENGKLKREDNSLAFLKANLYCFGRLDPNLTVDPLLRKGSAISALESSEAFSTAWAFYLEGDISNQSMEELIKEFNISTERDYRNGLIDKKITLNYINKLSKNSILLNINIGQEEVDFEVNV